MEQLFFALWFFLPVGLANTAPILAMKIPGLRGLTYPMDFHANYRGKRVFGAHKTFRGLVAGILLSILIVLLQQYLYRQSSFLQQVSPFDYGQLNPYIFGTLCATGALFGDAIESFFKRQAGVKPGKSWFPFDQIDYIAGGIICTAVYRMLPLSVYLLIGIVWFGMHLLFSWIGYKLGLKDSPI
jgi:CDP-2,3-bis-(O-geranylgeranyl)-sn-glycerol synthase